MGHYANPFSLDKDRVDLLQAITNCRKGDVLQAATRGQLVQHIQFGQGSICVHLLHRLVQHDDAQVKEEEGVRVVVGVRVRRPTRIANERIAIGGNACV